MSVSIRGTVTDADGNPLCNVKVLALHEPTGSLFAKITDQAGFYQFENIKPGGPYALTATGEGFPPVEEKGLKLRTEEVYEHNFNMT